MSVRDILVIKGPKVFCVEDGQLLGLISIGDLNAYKAHDHEVTIHILEEYIHGRS